MQAVARQILALQPELLSLQEVDQWYTGTFNPNAGTCGTMTLEYDMLQELLSALAEQGGHYEVAVQVTQNSFPPVPGLIPPSNYFCVSLNDYNIILARTDLPSWIFQWSNPQSGQFVNELVFPTPVGPLPYPRAWASVDAQFFGHTFLYVNTHLESFDPNIRELQGGELRAGPANTSLPLIVAMDSNAQAFPLPQDPTYVDFVSAGYDDVWTKLFPKIAGLTCCQDEADNNPQSELYQRIDLGAHPRQCNSVGSIVDWDQPAKSAARRTLAFGSRRSRGGCSCRQQLSRLPTALSVDYGDEWRSSCTPA